MTRRAGAALGVWLAALAASGPAWAQSGGWASWETYRGRFALHVNAALQSGAAEWTQSYSARAYGEDASFEGAHETGRGALVDAGGSLRVWRRLSVGATYTELRNAGAIRLSGSVPHPIRFGQGRSFESRVTAVTHRERATHVHAAWRLPIGAIDGLDVSVYGGPSWFNLTQGVLTGASVAETGPPFSTVEVTGQAAGEHVRNGWGAHVGADVTYLFTPAFGVGAVVRFSRGAVTLPSFAGTASASAGGLQTGGGLRFRF